MYSLTTDDLKKIVDYVEKGDESVLETDALSTFISLNAALVKRMSTSIAGKNRNIAMLERRFERIQKRSDAEIAIGNFPEAQRDSADVAHMLIYHLQMHDAILTKNKVIHILYLMYASWLYNKKERLFLEHPCATEWGPQFWRVYGRIDVKFRMSNEQYAQLAKADPAAAAFCKNAAQKYHDYPETDLKFHLKKSKPYLNALPETNYGKWNKEISDTDIFNWKKEKDLTSPQ